MYAAGQEAFRFVEFSEISFVENFYINYIVDQLRDPIIGEQLEHCLSMISQDEKHLTI